MIARQAQKIRAAANKAAGAADNNQHDNSDAPTSSAADARRLQLQLQQQQQQQGEEEEEGEELVDPNADDLEPFAADDEVEDDATFAVTPGCDLETVVICSGGENPEGIQTASRAVRRRHLRWRATAVMMWEMGEVDEETGERVPRRLPDYPPDYEHPAPPTKKARSGIDYNGEDGRFLLVEFLSYKSKIEKNFRRSSQMLQLQRGGTL